MKRILLLLLPLLASVPPCAADEDQTLLDLIRDERRSQAPELDPKRIVNRSNSFLKDNEPEMTAEEYALHEKVVTMLESNVAFALRMLEAMMNEKEPPSPAFEFILGNAHYAANRPDLAEKHYRGALKRFPNFVRAWSNLGLLYYTGNRFAEAIPCLTKAVTLGDREPANYGLLGFCHEKEGNLVAAELAYMQAINGDPANSDWKEGLLGIYLAGKQFGRAEPLARSLLKDKPTEKRFWHMLAGVMLSQGRKVEATVLLETASGMGIAGTDELLLLGDLYADQGLAAEALASYAKVPGQDRPRGEQKLLHYAQALIASDKLTEAGKVLDALGATPSPQGRLSLLQCRAELLLARRDWPGARAEAQALLKLSPLNGYALLALGRSHSEEQDFAHAMLAFEQACRIPESAYRACLELAGIELRNRRYAKAVEYLEKALSLRRSDSVESYLSRVKLLLHQESQSG